MWGALTIYSDEVDRFGHEDVKLLEKVAGDIGFALDNLDREFRRKQAEEKLLESENKFKSFAEQALAGIHIIQDGVFKYVNPKFAQMFGYTVEECLNDMPFKNLVYTEDLAKVEEQVRRRVSGEVEFVQHTFRGLKKDGQIFHVEVYGSAILYKGRPAATGTILDITERKLAADALRESEERFSRFFRAAPVSTSITRLSDGQFADVNDKFLALFGYEREEVVGQNPLKLRMWADPEDRAKMVEILREHGRIQDFETRFLSKSGEIRDVSVSAEVIEVGGQQYILGLTHDITERRQTEESLLLSEDRYRRLFEDAVLGIFRTTPGGKVVNVNPAYARMFGFDSPEEVKSQVNDVAVDLYVDPSRRNEILRMILDAKGPIVAENSYRRKDGSIFTGSLHAWVVRNREGKPLYLEGFVEISPSASVRRKKRKSWKHNSANHRKWKPSGRLPEA